MTAVLSRAAAPDRPVGCEELADLFCRQARRRIKGWHREIYCNDDRFAYRRARDLLDGGYPWLEENIYSSWHGTHED
jgi:hypothetical protein